MKSAETMNSVMVRQLTNGSRLEFGYCQNGADRIRGTSVDEISWDEIQDIPWEIMPVIEQCLSASKWRLQKYCGTPKTLDNAMEYLWHKSSQCEPVVICEHCKKDNVPSDPDETMKMISRDGPICMYCKRLLGINNIVNARFVSFNKSKENEFEGYHIPQIFIYNNLINDRWKDIWNSYEDYMGRSGGKAYFVNEVLGISYDKGAKLITQSELNDLAILQPVEPDKLSSQKYRNICAGIDWGISAVTSFTVIVIVGLRGDNKWDLLYHYKFLDSDTLTQIDEIVKILRRWRVDICGCDHGVGHTNNNEIRKRWSNDQLYKVCEFNYVKSNFLLSWRKDVSRYSLDKAKSLNNLFFEMKDGKILFPKTNRIQEVFSDILAEFEEVREGPTGISKIYSHPPEIPDDYLHAINFAIIVSKRMAKLLVVNFDEFQ